MANDFSTDTHCISLYRMENAAYTTDSKGTNILSVNGTVTSQTVSFQEGSACVLINGGGANYLYRTDANLSASTPLKSGTSNKTVSITSWFKLNIFTSGNPTAGNIATVWGKSLSTGSKRTFRAGIGESGGSYFLRMDLGDTLGANSQNILHATALTDDVWYHGTWTYSDSDKSYGIYLHQSDGSSLGSNVTGTATNNIALFAESDMMIAVSGVFGSSNTPFDGSIDELVVFDDVITASESNSIAAGTYVAPAASTPPMFRGS